MSIRNLILCISLLAGGATTASFAAVFGRDDRIKFDEAETPVTRSLLAASGGITCLDGSWGSGFVVDISDYVESEQDFYIIATTVQILYDGKTGEDRGRCTFLPAASPGTHLELRDRLYGDTRVRNADSDDWVFAKIDKRELHLHPLPIAFGNTYDFTPDIPISFSTVGYVPKWGSVALSSDCEADDKTRYPSLWKSKDDFSHMVLHNCDFLASSRGGPLVYLSDGRFFAIGINAGDGGGRKFPRLSGIPYDPNRGFHNFARRFDEELEQKLVAFVSRFAHIKNPSATAQAFSELVENVQVELTRLGYDAGPVDGLLGRKTREAIQAFQTTLNITPSGRISEELLMLLKARE